MSYSGIPRSSYCLNGSCRRAGYYLAVNGNTYCGKCAVKFISEEGIDFFWAHYWFELRGVIEEFRIKEQEDKARRIREQIEKKVVDPERDL